MFMDLPIMAWLTIFITIGGFSAFVGAFWEKITTFIGINTVPKADPDNFPKESSFKKFLTKINKKLDEHDRIINSLQDYTRNNRAYQLRAEIRYAIEHDYGKREVMRLYEVYKQIPSDDHKIRNGHIQVEVDDYIESKNKENRIKDFHNFRNTGVVDDE
jgi:hypothetical protein